MDELSTTVGPLSFDYLQAEICRASASHALAVHPLAATPLVSTRTAPAWQRAFEASRGVLFFWGHGDGMHMQIGASALCGVAPGADASCGCAYPVNCRKGVTLIEHRSNLD